MQTAKKLGFKKGDFVYTGLFPGIIISDAHTTTPCCEVWGVEHELGSVYATDLHHVTFAEFQRMRADAKAKFGGNDEVQGE